MSQPDTGAARRGGRLFYKLRVQAKGRAHNGRKFTETCSTVVVNSHGGSLLLKHELDEGEMLVLIAAGAAVLPPTMGRRFMCWRGGREQRAAPLQIYETGAGVCGVRTMAGAFFFLFRRDKSKRRHASKAAMIAA